jgi:hypothetical protein
MKVDLDRAEQRHDRALRGGPKLTATQTVDRLESTPGSQTAHAETILRSANGEPAKSRFPRRAFAACSPSHACREERAEAGAHARFAHPLAIIAIVLAVIGAACSGTQRPSHRVAVAYRFQCTPRDARVIVDEVDQGVCQLWEQQYLGLEAGTHRLRIEREGYLPIERELPSTGRRESVRVELREQPE